jgi:acetylornithine deacetylase
MPSTDKVVELLGELLRLPSVNPRLAAGGEPADGERPVTEWLARRFDRLGWPWATQPVHPGRSNIVAWAPGGGGETLLWEAHQDTVSTQGMTIEPFAAAARDERIYGRGACDVKGGMAAMLAALETVAAEPRGQRPDILFAATVNEECGFTGARALADVWRPAAERGAGAPPPLEPAGGLTLADLERLRPAAALVAEPTELDVVVAHRGVVRWRMTVEGRAAHSSRPEQGVNAIYGMIEVVRAIDEFHRQALAARPGDPLCGPSTACVTTIHGGAGANTVPERTTIDVDRRLLPDESPEEAYQELTARVAARAAIGACRLVAEPPWMQSRGLAGGANGAFAARVSAAARAAGGAGRLIGVPYGTNAATIAAAGIPAAVFGPGSINQAHTADEWIAVADLRRAVDALVRIARGG